MVRPGYKQTEIGLIPEDWTYCSIGHLVADGIIEKPLDGNHGNIHPKSSDYVPDGIPFIMANDFENDHVNLRSCHFIKKEQADKLQKGFAVNGDVLLTHKGTVGNVAILKNITSEYIMLTPQVTYYRVKDKKRLLSIFIKSYFENNNFQSILHNLSGGGTRAYIGIQKQLELPFILPPLPEQQAIAEALSDVDKLIDGLEKLIAKKRDIKTATMQQLLTGKTRLPGFEGEWEVKLLGELGSFLKGSGVKKDESQSGPLPCVRYGEIYTRHNDYIKEFHSFISSKVAATACLLKQGDLLFAGSGETKEEIGKCVAFVNDFEAYTGGDIVILRPQGVDSLFLGFSLNTPQISRQKASRGQGDAVVHISSSALADISVNLPPLPEQSAIAKVLTDIDAEMAGLEQRWKKTRALKQAMMQELLTGRTRII
jgi:type I restriction enzyme, S subunit